MASLVNAKSQFLPASSIDAPHFRTSPKEVSTQARLSDLMLATLKAKEGKKEEIEAKRKTFWGRFKLTDLDSDFWLIGGDSFSMGYLSFQAAQSFSHALAINPIVQGFTTVLGAIGGVINVAVGISCIVQGTKELRKGHKLDGARLLFDGILMIIIGLIMIAGPILLKFAAGSLFTAIATNPFVLPVLFALLSVFITYEILKKTVPMWFGTDLGSQLIAKLGQGIDDPSMVNELLNTYLTTQIKNESDAAEQTYSFSDIKKLIEKGEEKAVKEVLSTKMNQFEEKIGVDAALEVFKLMQSLLDLEVSQNQEKIFSADIQKLEIKHETILAQVGENLTQLMGKKKTEEVLHQLKCNIETNIEELLEPYMTLYERVEDIASHPDFESVLPQSVDPQFTTAKKTQKLMHSLKDCKLRIIQIKSEQIRNTAKINANKKRIMDDQQPILQQRLKEWKVAQHVRLIQQVFYIGASITTFATFVPGAPTNLINGIVNTSMAIANAIPLYMDIKWPYKRNVAISVPGVSVKDIEEYSNPSIESAI